MGNDNSFLIRAFNGSYLIIDDNYVDLRSFTSDVQKATSFVYPAEAKRALLAAVGYFAQDVQLHIVYWDGNEAWALAG